MRGSVSAPPAAGRKVGPARGDRQAKIGHDGPGSGRAHPLQQLQDAVPGQLVIGVVQYPEGRHQVPDMSRLEKTQPPVLHTRDTAAVQLDLEEVAVMSASEQHRLLAQSYPGLIMLEDEVGDRFRLRPLVRARGQDGPAATRRRRPESLGVAL